MMIGSGNQDTWDRRERAELRRKRRGRVVIATYVIVAFLSFGYHWSNTCSGITRVRLDDATNKLVTYSDPVGMSGCSAFLSVFWPVYWGGWASVHLWHGIESVPRVTINIR